MAALRARARKPGARETSLVASLERQFEQLKSCLRIAVIFAGDKSTSGSVIFQADNTRSWKSYEAVASDIAATLRAAGFRHVELMPEDMQLGERLRRHGTHLAWLNTGGVQGYNSASHAASLLEMVGVPYVGHNPLSATTLDNKHAFKREAVCAGLPTAPFSTWDMTRGPFIPELNSRFLRAFGEDAGPYIVKPVSGRASLNVNYVPDRAGLTEAIAEVYEATRNLVLIEKYLPGREFCVAVMGPVISRQGRLGLHSEPFSFGALERHFSDGEKIFTSMDIRPISGARFSHVDASNEPDLYRNMLQLAKEVYLEFGLESLVRLDLRSDEQGGLYILEANPKPDLKRPSVDSTSLIAAGLEQSDLSYDDLLISMLADKLRLLFGHRRQSVAHILALLKGLDLIGLDEDLFADSTDQMVGRLRTVADKMRSSSANSVDQPPRAAAGAR